MRTTLIFSKKVILICKLQPTSRSSFFEIWFLRWSGKQLYFLEVSFWKAPLCLVAPCGAFIPEKCQFLEFLDMSIFKKWAFLETWSFFQGRLPRPNHDAHWIRIQILSRTPVSILLYLSPRPQNLRKTSYYSFLGWMSTWISKWRRRRRRRRRFPKNSLHLVLPWEYHRQGPNIPCGESLTSTISLTIYTQCWGIFI